MGKYSGDNAPNVVFVLMGMPFVGAAFVILFGLGVESVSNIIEKRRGDNA